MLPARPVLYVFAISHYCEKARWALDLLGTGYELRFVAPGEHGRIAKQFGASRGSVPYLIADGQFIQGSAEIIDWAEERLSKPEKTLTPVVDSVEYADCARIEKRIDDVAGVHVRRYYYSEAIIEHPELVRPVFVSNLSWLKRLLIGIAWKKIQRLMIVGMNLGREQGEESRLILDGELLWLDEMLADGRTYLVGNRLSRADLAAASLLSPLLLPAEHPAYRLLRHPPRVASAVQSWEKRRSMQWVKSMYALHR